MTRTRRNHPPQFKVNVRPEALAGEKTLWRGRLMDRAAEIFGKGSRRSESERR